MSRRVPPQEAAAELEEIKLPARAHVFEMKVLVDSEMSEDILLFFCTGCGRPRPPKLRKITRDTDCVLISQEEVVKKVRERIRLVLAMVGGGHDYSKRGSWSRKSKKGAGPRI